MTRASRQTLSLRHRLSLLCATALVAAAPALAQQQGGQRPANAPGVQRSGGVEHADVVAADGGKLVTRVYDIRDLVMGLKQYPFRGTMLPARQTAPPVPADLPAERSRVPATAPAAPRDGQETTLSEREDELVRLITETVAPESWRDAGGTEGSVRLMRGQMIVTQSQTNHAMLQQLLTQLRATKGRMVRVRAHWLLLSPADAEKLVGAAGDAAVPPVDPAVLRNLPKDALHFEAQTVGYNTQTVHVASGPARTIVSDVDVQIGTAASGFDPVVELVRSGLVLEVTPLVTAANKEVVLDLYSAFVDPPSDGKPLPVRALAPPPAGGGSARVNAGEGLVEAEPPLAEGVVDKVNTTIQELRTTVQVPLNRPVLIGGMTLAPALAGEPSRTMYLVVEVVASEG